MKASGAPDNEPGFSRPSDGYGHPADKMFSMYLKEAEKVDHQMVEDWKGTTDGILIFAGLFSAVVTAFLIESYKGLSPDTDTDSATVVLLAQISSQLAAITNSSQPSNLQLPLTKDTKFYPSTTALAVNAMWFLSLSLSLVCALAATLAQYWARCYTRSVEQFQQSTHKRALLRALMFEGLEKSHVSEIVDAIPTLIHIALFLFLAGLVTFLHDISLPIAYFVLAILSSCAIMYAVAAILPLLHTQSTLRTPFSSVLWYTWQYISRFLPSLKRDVTDIEFAFHIMPNGRDHEEHTYIEFLESGFAGGDLATSTLQSPPEVASTPHLTVSISKAQEQLASVDGPLHYAAKKRMVRALTWIHGLANEDRELEAFLMAIPGLSVWEPSLLSYLVEHDPQVLGGIRNFFHRTIPFPWAPGERTQKIRAAACIEAMYHLTGAATSSIQWDSKWKIHREPLLFISDLAPYLRYCDKEDLSLVFCTITACLNLREPTLATITRGLVFYPDLDRSRQYIDQLLQFRMTQSPEDSISDAFSPFEFIVRTILPELSGADDRVSAYKHILTVIEAVWQSVQEPRARFQQTTFVNFLDKLLAVYSGHTKEPGSILITLTNMLEAMLKATKLLRENTARLQAISILSKYLDSNPVRGVAEARKALEDLKLGVRSSSTRATRS